MSQLPTIVALVAYGYVAVAHALPGVVGKRAYDLARAVAAVGMLAHSSSLVLLAYTGMGAPGFPEALSAAALGIMGAYLTIGQQRLRTLGLLLAPLALVMLGTAQVVPHHQVAAAAQLGPSPWLPLHLGLMVAGLAGFALSFAVGVTYLYVRDRLKKKKLAGIRRLPSLVVLDQMQFRSMLFGFLFLSLGIGVGGALAAMTLDGAWSLDPKVAFTTLIWGWYAVALQVRLVAGWRGRLSAIFSIVGFAGMIFSLVAINFLVGGFHAHVS